MFSKCFDLSNKIFTVLGLIPITLRKRIFSLKLSDLAKIVDEKDPESCSLYAVKARFRK